MILLAHNNITADNINFITNENMNFNLHIYIY